MTDAKGCKRMQHGTACWLIYQYQYQYQYQYHHHHNNNDNNNNCYHHVVTIILHLSSSRIFSARLIRASACCPGRAGTASSRNWSLWKRPAPGKTEVATWISSGSGPGKVALWGMVYIPPKLPSLGGLTVNIPGPSKGFDSEMFWYRNRELMAMSFTAP